MKKSMKKSLIVWCLAVLCAIPGLAAAVDRQAALNAVVAAEKAFAKAAAEKGTRAAFLEYLAEDSVVMAPGPVPGRATWEGRPVRPSLLSWFPVVADVSLAGDLGYTTGPWELRPKGKADTNVIHGFYTTFWRKQADGSFKCLFDGGISSPAPPASAVEVKIDKAVPAKVENPPQVEESRGKFTILSADRAFAKAAASRGTAAAYGDFLADDSRLHREGAVPVVSKAKILESLKAQTAKMTWAPIQARVASSGDLGYSVGNETIGAEQGFYVRIWKKQADASWRVVLDLFTPAPPEEKPAKPPGHP
ncbi:MAG TPA: nuclear transport factor 2 family protein [Thermoanaerobaculia bacterium]|jgi:ketosteroid isomerase-like protein|nr:nuclear transport factor 2 family protein [Thermoanaerobaculia bacterium]